MTLDKFKAIIQYGNTKVAWFIIGAMTMVLLDDLTRGEWVGALISVVVIAVNYVLDRNQNGEKTE